MTWDEQVGQGTRAFETWKATDADIRAYMERNDEWIPPAYAAIWDAAKAEFSAQFDPDRHDPEDYVDVFHRKVGGLWQTDYFWMLRSSVLRDAVTAFEVYAEKSLNEALSRYRATTDSGTSGRLKLFTGRWMESPQWPVLVAVHAAIGNDIEPEDVAYVRGLRHLLTHQRGELRTEEQRIKFLREANPSDWTVGNANVGGDVPLSGDRVVEMLDQLGDTVRAADPAAWRAAAGAGLPEAVEPLIDEKGRRGPLVIVEL